MTDATTDVLRGHGPQVTAQRLAILRAVGLRPRVATNDVAELVRDGTGTISRQSFRGPLTLPAAHGVLQRIQPAGSPAPDPLRFGDHCQHPVCSVDCATGETPYLIPLDDGGSLVDEAEAVGRVCPDGQAAAEPTP